MTEDTITLSTRLDQPKKGCIVVIMQRLHEDDLTGHLISGGGWDQLVLPTFRAVRDRGGKPYALLAEAMRQRGRCALAKWAWKSKQYVVQVRPVEDGLVDGQWLVATFAIGNDATSVAGRVADRGSELHLTFEERDWNQLCRFANAGKCGKRALRAKHMIANSADIERHRPGDADGQFEREKRQRKPRDADDRIAQFEWQAVDVSLDQSGHYSTNSSSITRIARGAAPTNGSAAISHRVRPQASGAGTNCHSPTTASSPYQPIDSGWS